MSNIISALLNFVAAVCLLPAYPFILLFAANIYLALILQAIFMACTQLFCLYIFKNKFVRLLPALYCGFSAICLLFEFIFRDFFRGWDSLIMVIQLAFVISCAVGLALSSVIHLVNKRYMKMRDGKLSANEAAVNIPATDEAEENDHTSESVPAENLSAATEAPAFIRNLFFRKYAKKKDSGLIFRMTVPENTWEKDTGILPNIFLFVFSGLYCLSYPIICFSMGTSMSRDVFTLVFGQLIVQLVMQLIFCYTFKSKNIKVFPAIHTVIIFASFLICSVCFAYFDGYIRMEEIFLSCLRYSCIGGIIGTALAWIIYYAHGLKRKADNVVILSAQKE